MLGIALLANRYAHLRALVLACWAALSPRVAASADAQPIASAIANAVLGDSSGIWEQDTLAAVMAVFVYEESAVRLHPIPWLDPKTGQPVDALAHGPFQIRGAHGFGEVNDQAAWWLVLLRAGAAACPASPSAPLLGACGGKARRIADGRVARARRLLDQYQLGNLYSGVAGSPPGVSP